MLVDPQKTESFWPWLHLPVHDVVTDWFKKDKEKDNWWSVMTLNSRGFDCMVKYKWQKKYLKITRGGIKAKNENAFYLHYIIFINVYYYQESVAKE